MQIQGHRIHVEVHGRGTAVILIHSSGLSGRQWGSLVEQGRDRYRFVVPDLLGSGRSAAWTGVGPDAMLADRELVGRLIADEDRVHLVGHSYGGTLALLEALAAPDRIASVAAFEAPLLGPLFDTGVLDADALDRPIPPTADTPEAWMAWLVDWWNGPGTFDRLGPATRADLLSHASKVRWEVQGQLADRTPSAAFAALAAPVLLLRGTATPRPVAIALDRIAAASPHARVEILEGGGHMAPLTHPGTVNRRILEHLDAS